MSVSKASTAREEQNKEQDGTFDRHLNWKITLSKLNDDSNTNDLWIWLANAYGYVDSGCSMSALENEINRIQWILGSVVKEHSTVPTASRQLIRAHPSQAGFRISLHGIRRKKKRTYLACKIPGCRLSFPSVREWNSHHRLMHKEFHLICNECKKKFNTPSFLRDHTYVHQEPV